MTSQNKPAYPADKPVYRTGRPVYRAGRPILVTGSHRSGSTWVGRMLSLSPAVKYVSEPFNPGYGLKVFNRWFTYIGAHNQEQYWEEMRQTLAFRGDFRLTLPALRYWSYRLWPLAKRPLLKDPIACLSAAWLAKNFDLAVVVLWRHPLAFYASLHRLNWHFDFTNFTGQPELMREQLSGLSELINRPDKSYAEEAAILWLGLYSVLDRYQQNHPAWLVRRHEDLAAAPVAEFKDLYDRLGLAFTDRIENKIKKYSAGGRVKPGKAINLQRDSAATAKNWQNKINPEEIRVIKEITGPLADKYYSADSWQ